jgi:hypothetical protein
MGAERGCSEVMGRLLVSRRRYPVFAAVTSSHTQWTKIAGLAEEHITRNVTLVLSVLHH